MPQGRRSKTRPIKSGMEQTVNAQAMTSRASEATPQSIVRSGDDFLAYETTRDFGSDSYTIELLGRFRTRAGAEAVVQRAGR
jgi:hypothetical protein